MSGRQEGQRQRRGDLRSRGQRERFEDAVQAEGRDKPRSGRVFGRCKDTGLLGASRRNAELLVP